MKIIILPRVLDKRSINTFGLFPNEQGAGVNFDLDETENFNDLFHSSFDEIASAYNRIISDYFSMSPSLCFPLAKSTIAPIYYVIFERATRLNKLKSKFSSNKLVIPVQSLKYHLKSCTKIDELASNDWEFNGFISYKLAPSFGISSVSYQSLTDEKPKKINHHTAKNHLFFLTREPFLNRIYNRINQYASFYFGTIPSFGLTQTAIPFSKAGLLGFGGFFQIKLEKFENYDGLKNEALRKKLVNRLFEETSKSFKKLCVDLKLKVDHEKFSESCKNLIIELMPSNLLEGFEQNYQIAAAQLKEKRLKPYLFSNSLSISDHSVYLMVAAKSAGRKLVGAQHGGHYGYMYQHATAEEWEYQFADKWVSWGWSHTIASRKIPAEKFVPMPSPWVSHRKEQWKNIPIEKAKHEFDITFLPNKIYPFCPSISGARSTGNFLPVISKSHYELLSCLMANNLRVFHKGYNQSTNYLMSETIERLKIEFPLQFNLSDHYDKGLNPELVSSSKIILWDQPGTGFLECLASGIPTLVFWPKIFNREIEQAKQVFENLEQVGIVHQNPMDLVQVANEYLKNQDDWQKNPQRTEAVKLFLDSFCRIDDNWTIEWKQIINSMKRNLL